MFKLKLLICCLWVVAPLLYFSSGYLPAIETSVRAAGGMMRASSVGANITAQNQKINFKRDVEPILKASCYSCHAGAGAQGELRLDSKAMALKGGVSGAAIIPGDSKGSLLVKLVRGEDPTRRMPPGKPLPKERVDTLARWIDEGAHWAESAMAEPKDAVTQSAGREATASAQNINFVKDIEPIFKASCYGCHAGEKAAGQLRLDARELALKGGISGQVITPGDSEKSRLVHRILGLHGEERMPLKKEPLTPEQISLVKSWINAGAQWPESASAKDAKLEKHWAFVAPVRPSVPTIKGAGWIHNPIDNFVLAKLERENLKPSPEADKATLLRRVKLDLTGLPPTPAEIDSFIADVSPDAYEKRVDEYLKSPQYGERMAMSWLDLARYADTHGYHIDSHRDMWPWRDWVIKAFTRNLPYDQFTIEQLAGDLLPNATLDQQIASGFNRNHMINFEGGAIPEEYQTEYVVDRVETTSNVWMGLTMGCARCHNHKYDPLTQKEFYQFYAFFNTVSEEGLDGRTGNAKPFLQLPSSEQKALLVQLNGAIKAKEAALADKEVAPAQEGWEKSYTSKVASSSREGLVAHYELDGSFSDISGRYAHGRTVKGDPTFGGGQVGRAVSFDGDSQVSFGGAGAFDRADKFSLAVWLRGSGNTPMSWFQKLEDAETRRGYEFHFDDLELVGIQKRAARLTIKLISRWPDNAIQLRTRKRLAFGDWHHVTLTYDGSGKAAGLKLFVNGKPFETEIVQDALTDSIATKAELQIGSKSLGKPFKGQLDDLRFYNRPLSENEIEQLAIHFPVENILSGVTGKRTKDEATRTRDYFLTYAAPEHLRQHHAELKSLKKGHEKLNKEIVTVMVMNEMEKPRETFVLARGDYRNKTEKVTAGAPAVLPSVPAGAPPNRLTLAKWLVDPAHPLTARVAVNRYWQAYFGLGLVKTSEDFGTRGETPIHAELLDWLATEFVRTGWDVRAMQRLIVTSAAYRQSSKVTPELRERDPENRLLARGARFRLPAETVRDNALAVSGLLNDSIGGASVFPYQPEGLWEELAFGDGFTAQTYTPSTGRDLYRRTMYTFWKRTAPPAALATFDAPDREKCTVRRAMTNTPLQALVLLNDPTYIEAARALATRTLREGGRDANTRIAYAFRLATGRNPTPEEARVLNGLLRQQTAHYRRDKKAANELLRVGESPLDPHFDAGELAAWTTLASAILNLDETITKE